MRHPVDCRFPLTCGLLLTAALACSLVPAPATGQNPATAAEPAAPATGTQTSFAVPPPSVRDVLDSEQARVRHSSQLRSARGLSLPLDDVNWRTDRRFRQALDGRISAVWRGVSGRTILQRLARQQEVAILLDGRINPSRKHSLELADVPLRDGLNQVAAALDAISVELRNAVYLGPPDETALLRTLIQLRVDELFAHPSAEAKKRQFALARRKTLRWDDLTTPRELLEQAGSQWSLQLEGLDQVPHDLWAAGALPEADATEVLSCVLLQYGLTFRWTETADGVSIVPLPDDIWIERKHTPRGQTARAAAGEWEEQFRGITTTVQGRSVLVRGTVEQHEAIEELIDPKSSSRSTKPAPATPLSRRRFTLRVERVPAGALLSRLKSTGIVINWDAKAMAAAGVDFTTPVTMNVRQATAPEFFRLICDPLDVTFEIDGITVTLQPRD